MGTDGVHTWVFQNCSSHYWSLWINVKCEQGEIILEIFSLLVQFFYIFFLNVGNLFIWKFIKVFLCLCMSLGVSRRLCLCLSVSRCLALCLALHLAIGLLLSLTHSFSPKKCPPRSPTTSSWPHTNQVVLISSNTTHFIKRRTNRSMDYVRQREKKSSQEMKIIHYRHTTKNQAHQGDVWTIKHSPRHYQQQQQPSFLHQKNDRLFVLIILLVCIEIDAI